jgi:hypothetical protein
MLGAASVALGLLTLGWHLGALAGWSAVGVDLGGCTGLAAAVALLCWISRS